MERRRRRKPAHILMRNIVITTGAISAVVNLIVLAVSASAGKWLFGPVFCQLYGLLGQVLISGSCWMVALAAMERCYYVLAATEHPATFSNTNLKVMVFGLYLMLMVLHTGPLYGWGEYSFLRGGLGLYINMTEKVHINVTQHYNFKKFTLTEEETLNRFNFSETEQERCLKGGSEKDRTDFTPPNIALAIQMFLEKEFECESRIAMSASLVIIMRFSRTSSLEMFCEYFKNGILTRRLKSHLISHFSTCNNTLPPVEFEFDFQEKELMRYTDVYIPFQDLGICTLDFSTVNNSISSWIPFVVLINVSPYLIALSCGCVLHKILSSDARRLYPKADFYIFCSLSGLLSILPYYYVNFQNHMGNYVSTMVNLIVTTVYFSSSLSYLLTFVCFSCCLNLAFLDLDLNEDCTESDDNSNNVRRKNIRGLDTCTSDNSEMSNSML